MDTTTAGTAKDLYHAALPADWAAALDDGAYTVSTRGVTLDEAGFIHCAYRHQVEGVANRYYGDLTDLVLLRIDPILLDADIIEERAARGGPEWFPHVYGPIPTSAIIEARPWRRDDDGHWRLPLPD